MIISSSFKPAWWLPGPHLQTIWPALMRRRPSMLLQRERLELPDGDFLDLNWPAERTTGPVVIVLHGLEGSIQSPYAMGIMQALLQAGYRPVFMHFRSCSGEPNRLTRAYHSGDTDDLAYVVAELQRRQPHTALTAIGYSLGGNVLLKWLGETGVNNPLRCAVAVSVPFLLEQSATKMNSGFSRLYQWHLLRQLRQKVINKTINMTSPIQHAQLKPIKSFWEFDDIFTAPLHGFKNAADYYRQSSSRQYLKHIRTPSLIIHAKDDPFMTANAIPQPQELSEHITLELTSGGGHVGFLSGSVPGRPHYWLEQRIPHFIKQQVTLLDKE